MSDDIESALVTIREHPALNNEFYDLWTSEKLTIDQLRLVVRNYGAFVRSFPDTLALLFASTTDLVAKAELVKTLYSEMGGGRAEKSHSVLFAAFFTELATKMGAPAAFVGDNLLAAELLPATEALMEGERALYASGGAISIGAQLALEWQAYTMLRKLYDGACNYASFWDEPDGFHEACEYYYVHIGEAEKEHKHEALTAARQYAIDPASEAQILEGFDRHLDLFATFWRSLAEAIRAVGSTATASPAALG
jgi:pyrroloquinoline quinone (PQQ) biosynthesis protein C